MKRPLHHAPVFTATAVAAVALMLGVPAAASAATPDATTFDAYSTGTTTATVEGIVDQNGETTTYAVQYDTSSSDWCASGGTTGSPGNTTTASDAGLPDPPNNNFYLVSIDLSGLTEGTEYCAQLIAVNASGEGDGGQVNWTEGNPTADTFDAFATGDSNATVEGDVNPSGQGASYIVMYDVASSQWCASGGSSGTPAGGTAAQILPFTDGTFHDVSVDLTGLSVGADYCAELVTSNLDGTSDGGQVGWSQPPPPPQVTLTVHVRGSGTVTSSPAGIDCSSTCSNTFAAGTQVTLTATASSGWVLSTWGFECPGSANHTCAFTLNSDETVNAFFTLVPSDGLYVQTSGTGSGTITSTPAGIDCGTVCGSQFVVGSKVTLTATPSPGSVFTGWSRGGCSGTATCSVTVLASGNSVIDANFDLLPPIPAPRCTVKPASSRVKLKGPKAGVLTVKIACDQAASLALTGRATIKVKTGGRTKTSHAAFKAKHGSAEAGTPLTMTMKLPKTALSKLEHHAAESVTFKLTAKNANGSRTRRATIKHLRG